MRGYICFSDSDQWFLRGLRRGFRHCFFAQRIEDRWVTIDHLAGYTELQVHNHTDEDMLAFLRERFTVIEVACARRRTLAPLGLMTCVEVCKRLAGIHDPFIITPWQLSKHLKKQLPKPVIIEHHEVDRENVRTWADIRSIAGSNTSNQMGTITSSPLPETGS